MTIALVDDSAKDLKTLYEHICCYCHERKVHFHIEQFTDENEFLKSLHRITYNLVFLDIYMEKATGIQLARMVQKHDPKCQIIFTTASPEFAVKAFRLHALDYLVKPFTYACLEDAMDRYEALSHRFEHYIELKEGRHYTRILISDIIYTDYYNHYIQVHTNSCVIRSYLSFSDFSPMLSPYPQFLWCYRNCMVNMDYIDAFDDKDFILTNGERIPIMKTRRQEITQTYANYVFDYVNGGIAL